jgi:YVTN family beta-propeller protein
MTARPSPSRLALVATLAAALTPALGCAGQRTIATLAGDTAPADAPADAPAELLIVGNKRDNSVTLIDVAARHTLATLPTGEGPHEVAASSDGRWAVVANYGAQQPGNSLTVLDLARHAVARTIQLAPYRRPHGITFLPGDSLLAVTAESDQAVLVVRFADGTVARTIPTGQAGSHMVSVRADGRMAYTANIGSGTVTELDLVAGRATRTLPVAPRTEGVAVVPDGHEVWVGSNTQHTVTVIDTRTWAPVDTLSAPGLPYRIAISADGRTAVVPNPEANVVRVFDVATRTERRTISMTGGAEGAQPVGVTLAADGRRVFVALQGTSEVAMVDLATGAELARFPVGAGPDGLAVTRRRGR